MDFKTRFRKKRWDTSTGWGEGVGDQKVQQERIWIGRKMMTGKYMDDENEKPRCDVATCSSKRWGAITWLGLVRGGGVYKPRRRPSLLFSRILASIFPKAIDAPSYVLSCGLPKMLVLREDVVLFESKSKFLRGQRHFLLFESTFKNRHTHHSCGVCSNSKNENESGVWRWCF
jgi:hypothetical protein